MERSGGIENNTFGFAVSSDSVAVSAPNAESVASDLDEGSDGITKVDFTESTVRQSRGNRHLMVGKLANWDGRHAPSVREVTVK